jgi:ferredoxin
MPLEDYKNRSPENTPGNIYVTWQCLDCDLCREIASTIFKRQDTEGYTYVIKQPETAEELEQVKECINGCCTQAIHDDGDEFDANTEYSQIPTKSENHNKDCSCNHYGLDSSSTPTSIAGSICQIFFRWFKR